MSTFAKVKPAIINQLFGHLYFSHINSVCSETDKNTEGSTSNSKNDETKMVKQVGPRRMDLK